MPYKFKCFGPYDVPVESDGSGKRVVDRIAARDAVFNSAQRDALRRNGIDIHDAIGLYVFGLSPSGSPVTWPYYVGKAASQTLFSRTFQAGDKPRVYSSIVNEYKRAKAFMYLFPLLTESGNLARMTTKGTPVFRIIEEAEYMMIGHAMNVNPFIYNVQNVVSRNKFVIEGTPQALRNESVSAKSFRSMMGFSEGGDGMMDRIKKSKDAFREMGNLDDSNSE